MFNNRLLKYKDWIGKFKINESQERIQNSDPRITFVDNFTQCIGYPGQGTHGASDWQSGNAWDLAAPAGSNVYSISSGTVLKVRKSSGKLIRSGVKKIYGDQLSIQSNDGKPNVFYTHIETNLTVGQTVSEGDVIGQIMVLPGLPSHLHIGLSNGNLIDVIGNIQVNRGQQISQQPPQQQGIPSPPPSQQGSQIPSEPESYPLNYRQTGRVYQTQLDPYKYCVINGVWYAKDGPMNQLSRWQHFSKWISLEKNCKMNQILDARFSSARTSTQVETNRMKFCASVSDSMKFRKEFMSMINADSKFKDLGFPKKSNNNPCQVVFEPDYEGCVGSSEGYCSFKSKGYGFKAQLVQLEKLHDNNIQNLTDLIYEILPPIENDLEDGLREISQSSGLSLTNRINKDDLIKIIPGIAKILSKIDITEEDVINSIKNIDSQDLESLDTKTFDGETAKIYLPLVQQDSLPLVIFKQSKDDKETVKDIVLTNLKEIPKKFGLLFPKEDNVDKDDLDSDIEDCLDDSELVLRNSTIISYDDPNLPDLISDFGSEDNLVNLVLINPPMNQEMLSAIKNLPSETWVFISYNYKDVEEKWGKEQVNNFVIKVKEIMKRFTDNPGRYVKEYSKISKTDLIEVSLREFIESIEININS